MGDRDRVRIIVAGSRKFGEREQTWLIWDVLKAMFATYHPHYLCSIVSGGCRGVDKLGERWAKEYEAPLKVFEADWSKNHKAAGPIRNREMAEYAAAGPQGGGLILIWDGQSRGSASMLKEARRAGVRSIVQVVIEDNKPRQKQTTLAGA